MIISNEHTKNLQSLVTFPTTIKVKNRRVGGNDSCMTTEFYMKKLNCKS